MLNGYKKYTNEILDDIECYKAVLDGRIKAFPRGFWTKPWSLQSASVITMYLLEERLKYTEEDIKTKVNTQLFRDSKLRSLMAMFNNSTYQIIENAYPNKFKPWELNQVPNGFWDNKENVVSAVKWLVETKLDNNRERVCKEFNARFLNKNKLAAIRQHGIYNLINMAYPNEFKPWELRSVSKGFWDDPNNVREVVRWLVETKLNNDKDMVRREFNQKFLMDNGVRELMKFGLYNVINITYPNEFKQSEFTWSRDK